MRLLKQSIKRVSISVDLEGENDKHIGDLDFSYDTEKKTTAMDNWTWRNLSVEEAQALMKWMLEVLPKLEKAVKDVLSETRTSF